MKIHQLPIGARFEFEGEEYVKTGPMFGTGKESGQRLIPKYAVLTVLGGEGAAAGGREKSPSREAVARAAEAFHSACRQLVPEERQGELDAARDRFMKALKLAP